MTSGINPDKFEQPDGVDAMVTAADLDELNMHIVNIANQFRRLVREELEEHLAEIDERNARNDEEKNGCCATHDFCDANLLMLDAFCTAMGLSEDQVLEGMTDEHDHAATHMWNEAWRIARTVPFSQDVNIIPARRN